MSVTFEQHLLRLPRMPWGRKTMRTISSSPTRTNRTAAMRSDDNVSSDTHPASTASRRNRSVNWITNQ